MGPKARKVRSVLVSRGTILGASCAVLEAPLAAILGPSCCHLGRLLGSSWGPLAPFGRPLGAFEGPVGGLLGRLAALLGLLGRFGAILGPRGQSSRLLRAKKLICLKNICFPKGLGRFLLVRAFLGVLLEPCWGVLGDSRGVVKPSWEPLGLSWTVSERSWNVSVASWAVLERPSAASEQSESLPGPPRGGNTGVPEMFRRWAGAPGPGARYSSILYMCVCAHIRTTRAPRELSF